MPKKSIVHEPNPVLRQPAADIPPGEIRSAKIQRLISDMRETLAAAWDGVGLAAPQVGVPLRIFLVSDEAASIDTNAGGEPSRTMRMNANDANSERRTWEYHAYVNPVLKKRSQKKIEMAEGCLSVPGKFGLVPRAEKVYLEWLDERGRKHSRGFTKFFARVIQHELDHLDGKLILDRAKRLFTAEAKKKGAPHRE